MSASNNNETVHISFGNTANHISSHLLNLQGLAATSSSHHGGSNDSGGGDTTHQSLCDPSVTHDISSVNPDNYATYATSSSSNNARYMYVPRTLIVDGRDSFGVSWGDSSSGSGANPTVLPQSSSMMGKNGNDYPHPQVPSWNGSLAVWDSRNLSEFSTFGEANSNGQNNQHESDQSNQRENNGQQMHHSHQQSYYQVENDPLQKFRTAASMMGLSPHHSRFSASAPSRHSSYIGNNTNSRHVQWDQEEEEEEGEVEDDDYCYGQNKERLQEEQRRQLEKLEYQNEQFRRNWNDCMEDAWEEAFYGGCASNGGNASGDGNGSGAGGGGGAVTSMHQDNRMAPSASTMNANTNTKTNVNVNAMPSNSGNVNESSNGNPTTTPTNNDKDNKIIERDIHWNDYWMPPRPLSSKYQVLLPFDTAITSSNSNPSEATKSSTWSSSFSMGYHPGGGSTGGTVGGAGCISQHWRENTLSEALRKVLEGCDVVKGFNVFVDGGQCGYAGSNSDSANPSSSNAIGGRTNKHEKNLSNIIAGGGFYAGVATSLLEELQEECRSAGRWVVLADPIAAAGLPPAGDAMTESNQVNQFRRCLNAGLALHGLSTNADAFLPVSIDGAYNAIHGNLGGKVASQNRTLFEGSAAIALALETSTLFYRLHRQNPSSNNSNPSSSARSRLGIQSGFYQGYSGNTGYGDDNENSEPYAMAPSLTYHEFLACLRPSSDKRRSILELDALLHPLSFPSAGYSNAFRGGAGLGGAGPLFSGDGSALSSLLLTQALSGIVGGSGAGNSAHLGELHKKMMTGTSVERIRMEQEQHRSSYSRSRGVYSSRQKEPGEWMEDISANGGILSSMSGSASPFGRRSDHHHFALSASLRPSASDCRSSVGANTSNMHGGCSSMAYLRPIMESLGVKYRPEVSSGVVVRDSVVDLTSVNTYWRAVFSGREAPASSQSQSSSVAKSDGGSDNQTQQQKKVMPPRELASHTPILSILGNSTRSYPRMKSVSSGFVDALHSRRNMGYLSRDVMAGVIPEKDDCEDALEYCRELVDVYEPPRGSGLVDGEDENDDEGAYFDDM